MAEVDVYAEADQAAASENAFLDAITGIAQPLATASPGEPSSLSPSAPFNVFFGRVSFVPSLFGKSPRCEHHHIRHRWRIDTEMFVGHMLVVFLHRRGRPLRKRLPL